MILLLIYCDPLSLTYHLGSNFYISIIDNNSIWNKDSTPKDNHVYYRKVYRLVSLCRLTSMDIITYIKHTKMEYCDIDDITKLHFKFRKYLFFINT